MTPRRRPVPPGRAELRAFARAGRRQELAEPNVPHARAGCPICGPLGLAIGLSEINKLITRAQAHADTFDHPVKFEQVHPQTITLE